MSLLAERAAEYLRLRHALGHKLADADRLLPRFVAYMERVNAPTITTQIALDWVQQREVPPNSSVWPRRMMVVRGFARHMAGIDPQTEIPPLGLVSFRQRWRPPFIFASADVAMLMAETVQSIPTAFRAATVRTMIGLLAVTGMRIGEVLRLETSDINWTEAVLVVKESKFTKSRLLPLDATTLDALRNYAAQRKRQQPQPSGTKFFTSSKGTPVIYADFSELFRRLVATTGVGAGSASVRPRIHDLRHSFAVHTLVRWYRAGEDVAALLPRLSTYLGHRDPRSTYWYLSAAPELLALAAARLERGGEQRS
jgi:integrase